MPLSRLSEIRWTRTALLCSFCLQSLGRIPYSKILHLLNLDSLLYIYL